MSGKRKLSREPLGAFDNGFRIHLSTGNCHQAWSLSLNGCLHKSVLAWRPLGARVETDGLEKPSPWWWCFPPQAPGWAKESRGLGRCHSAHCDEQPQGALGMGKVTVTISGSCCDWKTSPAHTKLRRRGSIPKSAQITSQLHSSHTLVK